MAKGGRVVAGALRSVLVMVALGASCLAQTAAPGTARALNGHSQENGTVDVPKTPAEAQNLVRGVIEHQMAADKRNEGPSFLYLLSDTGKRGTVTKEMIETKEGIIARLVAIDGRPPSAEERKADEERLNKLLNDPHARQDKARKQQEDDERTRKMVRALPDAFLYGYDSTVPAPRGPWIRLKFKPNPDYDPPSRELQVFQGMEGHMTVDPRAQRLVEIDAKLFRDVNFGWGILGHLDKGGEFLVRQSDVTGHDDWEVTEMKLRFDGKALIFKPIHIREDDSASNFRVVPKDLTFAQGVEMLRKQDTALAEKK